MKRKYEVKFKNSVSIHEVKSELSFGVMEGRSWLKEKYPDSIKIIHVKENRGGTRIGSGQKKKYGEETETISFRCPLSKIKKLKEIVGLKLSEWAII